MTYILLMSNLLIWGIAPVLIKWLGLYFDIHTQNFYRYLGASIFLLLAARAIYPLPWHGVIKRLNLLLCPAILIVITQILWVSGIYLSKATVSQFVAKLDYIFIILFSCLIFRDEREIVKSARFQIGVILAFIGVGGVAFGRGKATAFEMGPGLFLVFLSRITWALYTVMVKKSMSGFPPLVSTSLVISMAVILLFPIALQWGELEDLSHVPFWVMGLLFASGIVCIGVGQGLFFHNIKRVGTVITSSFIFATPLFTLIFGFLILGENLSVFQIFSGLLILTGCYIILPLAQKILYRPG